MKKKSSNWFEGKYVAMKDGGYLDITEAMHDSCDGKFCFQVTAEIFRNCSRNEDGKWYRESLLGKCCVCGEYKELGIIASKGKMCFECWTNRENR